MSVPPGGTIVSAKPARDVDELAVHLRAAVGALVRSARSSDRLAPIPAAVLDLLDSLGPMTTAELATSRGVRHQTMATTVKDLIAAGDVVATPDPGDGRKKMLALTATGKRAIEADRRDRVAALAEALSEELDDDERRALASALGLVDRVAAAVVAAGHARSAGSGPITGPW